MSDEKKIREARGAIIEWKRLRKTARDQVAILNQAIDHLCDQINEAEDWLFLHEPRTARLKFHYESRRENVDNELTFETTQRWFDYADGVDGPSLEEVSLLVKALGYEDEDAMWKGLGLFLNKDVEEKDGAVYEVTFKGDGTATIKEVEE